MWGWGWGLCFARRKPDPTASALALECLGQAVLSVHRAGMCAGGRAGRRACWVVDVSAAGPPRLDRSPSSIEFHIF